MDELLGLRHPVPRRPATSTSLDDLVARTPQEFRDEHRIDVRLHHEVVGIDLDGRTLEVRDHAHQRTFPLPFDQLHVATGARPTRPDLPGIDLDHVQGRADARRRQGRSSTTPARRECRSVVVVGGGYIGLEMAEAFVRWGAQVTLVEGGDQLMGTLDPDMAERLLGADAGHGHRRPPRTPSVAGFEPGQVQLEDGAPIDADLVVLGLGVTPNTELAGEAGVETGRERRHRGRPPPAHDARRRLGGRRLLRVAPPRVAAGRSTSPSAPSPTSRAGSPASTSAGGYATFPGVVGTAITKVCDLEVARTGLTEREAAADGFEAVAASIEATTSAGYLPGREAMTVKLWPSGAPAGCSAARSWARRAPAKRIDTVATALHARHARRRPDRPRPRLRPAVLDAVGPDPGRRPAAGRRALTQRRSWQTGAWH